MVMLLSAGSPQQCLAHVRGCRELPYFSDPKSDYASDDSSIREPVAK
jgi:hypothetical protein